MASSENRNADDGDDKDYWIPDHALNNLVDEATIHGDESYEAITKRLFRENSAIAAQSIIAIAIHSNNERMRLDAGKYIIERVLGATGKEVLSPEDNPINSFIEEISDELKKIAETKRS